MITAGLAHSTPATAVQQSRNERDGTQLGDARLQVTRQTSAASTAARGSKRLARSPRTSPGRTTIDRDVSGLGEWLHRTPGRTGSGYKEGSPGDLAAR